MFFEDGPRQQTWQSFTFANSEATNTGVIAFGGWADKPSAQHISLRDVTIAGSCTSYGAPGDIHDHGSCLSMAPGAISDVLIQASTVDCSASSGLGSAVQWCHAAARSANARNVTVWWMKITAIEAASEGRVGRGS